MAHGHGHGGYRQHQRQKGRQQQELLGTHHRLTQRIFRIFHADPALIGFDLRADIAVVTAELLRVACKLITPGDAASRLDRPGFADVSQIHQQPWRGLERVKARIWLLNHLTRHA